MEKTIIVVLIVLLAVAVVLLWQRQQATQLALLEDNAEDAQMKQELARTMSEVYARGVAAGRQQEKSEPRWDDYQDFADEVVGRMRAQLLWRQLNQPGFGLGLPGYGYRRPHGRRHRRKRDDDDD